MPEPGINHVKSKLLPLSWWERTLEMLVECLPRRPIGVELTPNEGIVVIDERMGEYKAITNAPSFAVTFSPASPQGGWYYLEAALVRNNGNREISIRADIGGDGKKSVVMPIPTNLRGTVREVVFLPPDLTALHWLPTAAPGFFSQSRILVHRITALESALRRMHRVLLDLWRFRGRDAAARMGLSWRGAIRETQGRDPENLHRKYCGEDR